MELDMLGVNVIPRVRGLGLEPFRGLKMALWLTYGP